MPQFPLTRVSFFHLPVLSISFCLFLLTTKHLIRVYKWLTAVAIVCWSYSLNESYVKYIVESKERRTGGGGLMEDFLQPDFATSTADTSSSSSPSSSSTIYPEGIFYTFVTNYICQVWRTLACFYSKTLS